MAAPFDRCACPLGLVASDRLGACAVANRPEAASRS
jgi:hypothetical protein